MLNILVRLLLVIAAFITSIFVARDALNFEIIQMVVGILLFTLIIFFIAFWPMIKNFIAAIKGKFY